MILCYILDEQKLKKIFKNLKMLEDYSIAISIEPIIQNSIARAAAKISLNNFKDSLKDYKKAIKLNQLILNIGIFEVTCISNLRNLKDQLKISQKQ